MLTENENHRLISIEEAIHITEKSNMKNHQDHINPSLVRMLRLLKFNKVFVKAEGCCVWDEAGVKYLDFLGGYGSLNLGQYE